MPPNPARQRGSARGNLKTKRLVYIRQEDVFRYAQYNPFTCVQFVTFKQKNTDETTQQLPGTTKTKFTDPLAQMINTHNLNTIRVVQFFNCSGHKQGERQRL